MLQKNVLYTEKWRENTTDSKKESKEHVTFRIDKHVFDKLKFESDDKKLSVSMLINQALEQYVNWETMSREAGFLLVRNSLLTKLLERLSEKDIIAIGEDVAKNTTKDTVISIMGKYDLESCLNFIVLFIKKSYSYKHIVNDTTQTFVIQHNLGKKWSLYLKSLYQYIFEDFGLEKINFDVSENTLTISGDIWSTKS